MTVIIILDKPPVEMPRSTCRTTDIDDGNNLSRDATYTPTANIRSELPYSFV